MTNPTQPDFGIAAAIYDLLKAGFPLAVLSPKNRGKVIHANQHVFTILFPDNSRLRIHIKPNIEHVRHEILVHNPQGFGIIHGSAIIFPRDMAWLRG